MTIWALGLIIVGLALSIYSANARMSAKLDEPATTRRARASDAVTRFILRMGVGMLLVGIALFALSIIIHTVIFVLTIVAIAAVVVGFFTLLSILRRPGAHS